VDGEWWVEERERNATIKLALSTYFPSFYHIDMQRKRGRLAPDIVFVLNDVKRNELAQVFLALRAVNSVSVPPALWMVEIRMTVICQ